MKWNFLLPVELRLFKAVFFENGVNALLNKLRSFFAHAQELLAGLAGGVPFGFFAWVESEDGIVPAFQGGAVGDVKAGAVLVPEL